MLILCKYFYVFLGTILRVSGRLRQSWGAQRPKHMAHPFFSLKFVLRVPINLAMLEKNYQGSIWKIIFYVMWFIMLHTAIIKTNTGLVVLMNSVVGITLYVQTFNSAYASPKLCCKLHNYNT